MTIEAFEKELQGLDRRLSIMKSQMMDTAGIFFEGMPLGVAIPRNAIFDEPRSNYGVEMPNGNFYKHRTRPEALSIVRGMLNNMANDKDYRDAVFGTGKYSDEALK